MHHISNRNQVGAEQPRVLFPSGYSSDATIIGQHYPGSWTEIAFEMPVFDKAEIAADVSTITIYFPAEGANRFAPQLEPSINIHVGSDAEGVEVRADLRFWSTCLELSGPSTTQPKAFFHSCYSLSYPIEIPVFFGLECNVKYVLTVYLKRSTDGKIAIKATTAFRLFDPAFSSDEAS